MKPAPGARVDALDGLRGVAIIMVLFVHFVGDATPYSRAGRAVVKLANYGIFGVDLFFVLSGFLITGILWDSKSGPRYFRNFYVRRTLRIFPLYYGTLAILFGVLPALGVVDSPGLDVATRNQGWLWAYGTNFFVAAQRDWALPYVSHFWSLAVEEHFYFVWPLVVLIFSRRALLRISVAGIALALGLRIALARAGAGDVAITALTPCRLDALLVGAFLALAVRGAGLDAIARPARPAFFAAGALVMLVSGVHLVTRGAYRDVLLPVRGTLVAVTFGALLVMSVASTRATLLGRVLQSRPMRFFGKYSYGLYVFHGIVAAALLERGTEEILAEPLGSHRAAVVVQALGGAAVSIALAVASYELFEKRILRLKDRFAPAIPAIAAIALFVSVASCVPRSRSVARCAPPETTAETTVAEGTLAPAIELVPSPLVSRGKRVVGWSPARWSRPERAIDGDYRSWWEAGRPTAAQPAWIAIDVGVGPKRILLSWIAGGSPDYEETDYGSPGSYRVEVSADSTDGENGAWKVVASVAEVKTHGAEHAFDFAGQRWVKMVVTGAPAVSPNGVQLGEIDLHDASAGATDTWFFMGDSITAAAFDREPARRPSFADCVAQRHPAFFPMMIAGGTGGTTSRDGASHVDEWIARNPDVRFWAIGYGSNDAAGDARDITTFRASLELIVSRLRAAGRVPILATIPYASDGQHAGIPTFNLAIEDVRAAHGLTRGPDLYAWFAAHPDELRDGLHPNDRGAVSMNRLWADAVEPLYAGAGRLRAAATSAPSSRSSSAPVDVTAAK